MDIPDNVAEELEELQKQLPDDIDMDEIVAKVTKLAQEFVQGQAGNSLPIQVLVFLGFLLIPMSLILYCFCKLVNSQKKRSGKDKKKQKETKKDTKKKKV